MLKKIDEWILSLEGKCDHRLPQDQRMARIKANLQNICGALKAEPYRILVTGSVDSEQIEAVAQQLSTNDTSGMEFVCGADINISGETVKLAAVCDGIVLVEEKDSSLLHEIERELEAIKFAEGKLLGFILLTK